MNMTTLEAVAVVFGIVSVFLSSRQNIWSWPTAIVNVSMFSVLFFRSGLYSDTGLQIVYLVLSIYGWYQWLYGGKGHTKLKVTRTSKRTWVILIALGIVLWFTLSTITSRLPGTSLPRLDSATTTVSLIAQWMMTRKLLENWLLWVGVDIVYIGMFIYKDLHLTAINYAVYLVIAGFAYVSWKKSMTADPA